MSFNQVFLILLLGSALAALTLPPAAGDRARGKIDNLFYPVAALTRGMASSVSERWKTAPPAPTHAGGKLKTTTELQEEVYSLTFMLTNVSKQLELMKKLNGEMRDIGKASDYSRRYRAFAGDAGTRKTLSLRGSSFGELRVDMPVICSPYQLVGKLQNVALAGTRVLLITDSKFPPIQGEFRRYEKDTGVPTLKSPAFVVNAIDGVLHIQNLKISAVHATGLRPGDLVCLADSTFPEVVQGVPIGEIASINESTKLPLFADIILKPQVDLMRLTEVMVVVGKKRAAD